MASLSPDRYRIHRVAELTGVPAPTLRSWERRYGVPEPRRSAHAYRLYDADDVAQIQEMQRLLEAGVSAAEAAARCKASPRRDNRDATTLGESLLVAARALDPMRLHRQLTRLDAGPSVLEVYDTVLVPTLHRAGLLWEAGELGIDEEHLLSRGIEGWLRRQLDTFLPLRPKATVLLGCLAGEQHTIGLYGAALRLARWNVFPVVLGAATPPQAVRHAVRKLAPQAVALSTTIEPAGDRLAPLLAAYREAIGKRPWIVGGSVARTHAALIASSGGELVDDVASLEDFARRTLRVRPRGG